MALALRVWRCEGKNAFEKASHVEHHYEGKHCVVIHPLAGSSHLSILIHKLWVLCLHRIVSTCNFLFQFYYKNYNNNQDRNHRKVYVQEKVFLKINGCELWTHSVVALWLCKRCEIFTKNQVWVLITCCCILNVIHRLKKRCGSWWNYHSGKV